MIKRQSEMKKILSIGCEGGGADLFIFKAPDGKHYFCTTGSSISLDTNDDEEWVSWETDAVETIAEGISSFKLGFRIFRFHPLFIHPEHRAEIKAYLDNLYADLTEEDRNRLRHFDEPITPETWLDEADAETERRIRWGDKWN